MVIFISKSRKQNEKVKSNHSWLMRCWSLGMSSCDQDGHCHTLGFFLSYLLLMTLMYFHKLAAPGYMWEGIVVYYYYIGLCAIKPKCSGLQAVGYSLVHFPQSL